MNNRLMQDREGNLSSKRVIGAIVTACGVLLLVGVGITSIFRAVADPQTAMNSGVALITAGCGLLGISVFEGVRK